jgi:hypothetical protein
MIMKRKTITFQFIWYVFILVLFANVQTVNAESHSNIKLGNEEGKVLMAGAAVSNVTPFLGIPIIGGFNKPEAAHIRDELHARCLLLDDGSTKLVFIIVDNLGLNREVTDEAKELILEKTDIPPEQVLIAGTHTHSGPRAEGEYKDFLVRRLGDVVRIALNNMEPARIGWGSGSVPEHVFVRRWFMKPGTDVPDPFGGQDKVKMNPGRSPDLLKPAAEPDPEVTFISVQSVEGRPIALLANYSLHYVGGHEGGISADYFGVFADCIQELLDADRQYPPFVGIMTNGTSGDVNNINFGPAPSKSYPRGAKMRLVADDVAREVFRVYNSVEYHDWVPLRARLKEVNLKVRKPDQKMITRAEKVLKDPDSVELYHRLEEAYAQRILDLLEWPDQIDVVVQTFGIGDLGVATTPFETFAETGLEIKGKSPFEKTFTIELANGYYGYLPTPEQHELGGYETWMGTNKVEKEASVKIVANLIDMFSSMK